MFLVLIIMILLPILYGMSMAGLGFGLTDPIFWVGLVSIAFINCYLIEFVK